MIMLNILQQTGPNFMDEIGQFKDQVDSQLNYNLNKDFNGRKTGDNPDDMTETHYGNNNVIGPEKKGALHGTHVAGIIAAVRGNGIGMDGVANNVWIMPVRAVPNGDEYDKDIALAIRYAVDNGAKVINGSFGKSFSPHKQWVYDAIKYAASKDVLFVHAAGNDGHDIDKSDYPNFPRDSDDFGQTEYADNVITVGALNDQFTDNLPAPFSNYGTKEVDVFAPGMKIWSTVPDNKYVYEQGTSMASPEVAGVAAVIREYYPKLTAKQVKQILMESGVTYNGDVKLGETKEVRPFSQASKSGKIVNAYNALVMADQMANGKLPKNKIKG
jgi:subtilisin family serine protease